MQDYLRSREELIAAAVPGPDSARRLAHLTDEVLVSLADNAAPLLRTRKPWSLVALGGYGAGALLPASDIDLLLLSDAPAGTLKPFVEAILYPLWDAGLAVGHQVRSRRDQLRAVREDTATLTATLTGRVIAGDERLGADVLRACAADAAKRSSAVLAALRERERPDSPYLLEPDLKEGAGGRRDYDELTWTAAVLTGSPQRDPSPLVSLERLTAEELDVLERAAATITAARWELNLAGAGVRMAEDAAADMRTDATDVQQALADTHHLLLLARRRAERPGRRETGPLSAARAVDLALEGAAGLERLEEAAWSGRLDADIPGMRRLMTLRRPGLAHTLTVGAHCLLAATIVGDILRDQAADSLAQRSAHAVADPRIPVVAALVHDVGKVEAGTGHAVRGSSIARELAYRAGLAKHAGSVATLVLHHLVLAETAARADLDQEDTALQVAETIADRALVAPLHVLTAADSLATGPGAWSDWHAALIGKLVARVDAALSPDVDGAGLAARAHEVREDAAGLLELDDPRAPLLAEAPIRFIAARSAEEILRHLALAAKVLRERSTASFALDVTVGPLEGSYRATIAAMDRPGLFATIAGVFALAGLDILGTEAGSGTRDVALDTFTVRSATLAPVDHDAWIRFERLLALALKDRLAIGVRLAERSRHYPHGARRRPTEVQLSTDDPFATVLRVRAQDRVGLLYDIARAITDVGLNISSATVITRDGVADDVFRLTDGGGEAPQEAGILGQLQMRLRTLR